MNKLTPKYVAEQMKSDLDKVYKYMEMMTAAYLSLTDIHPEDAIMVTEETPTGVRIWFESKEAGNEPND